MSRHRPGRKASSRTQATNRNGQSVQVTYDAHANVLTTTEPVNGGHLVTTSTYDFSGFELGRPIQIQEGAKTPIKLTYYDGKTLVNGILQANGLLRYVDTPLPDTTGTGQTARTTFTYTALGNISSVAAPAPATSGTVTTTYNYTFDTVGNYAKPEALGEPVTITDPLGHVTHFRYDSRGNVIAVIDANLNETDYVYNIVDQITRIICPSTGGGRASTANLYAYMGGPLLTTQLFDEAGAIFRTSVITPGSEGEVVKTQTSGVTSASVGYDGLYRPARFSDGKGQASGYTFDKVSNLSILKYPLGDKLQFPKYDADSNLLTRLDGRYFTTSYTRAADDSRLTDIKYAADSTQNVHLDYDKYGRITHMSDTTGTTDYTYDDLDNLLSVTVTYSGLPGGSNTHGITYAYFPDGHRSGMTLNTYKGSPPTQQSYTFSYTYNSDGTMLKATFPWTSGGVPLAYVDFTYYDNAWLKTQHTPRTRATYTYNARGFLTDLTNTNVLDSTTISQFSGITYDAAGSRTFMNVSVSESPSVSGSVTDYYDALGRLVRETSTRTFAGYDHLFAYDAANNLTTLRGAAQTYNPNNQITTGGGYGYDGNGNPTTYAGTALTFDQENGLATIGGLLPAEYRADGLRGSQNGAYFLYDGETLLAELNSSGSITRLYGYGAHGLAQKRLEDNGFYYAYTFDPSGNLCQRFASNEASGQPVSTTLYDAYGRLLADKTAGGNYVGQDPVGYAGRWGVYTDKDAAALGLMVMGYRWYDPENGRFMTRDPMSYDAGANLYTYCDGDPVNRVDPLGLQHDDELFGHEGDALDRASMRSFFAVRPSVTSKGTQRAVAVIKAGANLAAKSNPITTALEAGTGNDMLSSSKNPRRLSNSERGVAIAITLGPLLGMLRGAGLASVARETEAFKDFNQARNAAVEWLGSRGFRAQVVVRSKGLGGSVPGRAIGMMTADGKVGYRIEWDEKIGAHINVWDFNAPKGSMRGPHFSFPGGTAHVNRVTSRMFR